MIKAKCGTMKLMYDNEWKSLALKVMKNQTKSWDFYSDYEIELKRFELNNKGKDWGLNGYGPFTLRQATTKLSK